MTIQESLMLYKDDKNAAFQAKLTPGVPTDTFLGVKTPNIRIIEKQFRNLPEKETFLNALPHKYFDENMLHGIFISNMKSYDSVISAVNKFLPYIDNWAVCDSLRPNVFKKEKNGLIELIRGWISSQKTYVCRFGVGMLMTYYLDGDFSPEYLAIPAAIHSDEYYINMMIAWFYATALAKRWEDSLPYIENGTLDSWVHNKTIQKACESYRISDERKAYLKKFRK